MGGLDRGLLIVKANTEVRFQLFLPEVIKRKFISVVFLFINNIANIANKSRLGLFFRNRTVMK